MSIANTIRNAMPLRALLCLAIAVSLNTQLTVGSNRTDDRRSAPALDAVVSHAGAILAARGNHRLERANERRTPSPLILATTRVGMSDAGRHGLVTVDSVQPRLSIVRRQSGRSPPYQVSQ
ncbi:MAG TPA: hypothetical protein VGH38_23735 [Bryobacteraceae bacterium]